MGIYPQDQLQPLIDAANGGPAAALTWTGIDSDDEYGTSVFNDGAGGHFNIPGLFSIEDGGDMTITSDTRVVNLNADMVDGKHASDFALQADLDDLTDRVVIIEAAASTYVLKAGDTMTGQLLVRGGTSEVSVKVQYANALGVVSIGAENAAAPDLIVKNNAVAQIGRFTNEGLFMAGALTTAVGTAGANDVQCNDVWFTDTNNVRRIAINGTTLQFSSNATSGGTPATIHGTIDSAGTWTIPQLVVDDDVDIGGDSVLHGTLDVVLDTVLGADLLVNGSSTFTDPVRFTDTVSWDDGSGSGFAFATTSNARINVTIPGVGTFKIPCFT